MSLEKEFLTTSQAAELLGYTIQHTRLLLRQGDLNGKKIGRDWLISRESIDTFLSKKGVEYQTSASIRGRPSKGRRKKE